MAAPKHPTLAAPRPDILRDLVNDNLLSEADAHRIRVSATSIGKAPEFVLVELGMASEVEIIARLSRLSGLEIWKSEDGRDIDVAHKASRAFLQTHVALPLDEDDARVRVAMADPFDPVALQGLSFAFAKAAYPVLAAAADIRAALGGDKSEPDALALGASFTKDLAAISEAARASPAARNLDALLVRALDRGASDIHIEPRSRGADVRIRIDGILTAPDSLDADLASAMTARVKVLAELNVAETRLPQDGRVTIAVRGAPLDIRVATMPSAHGEAMTLRLLNRAGQLRTLGALGLGSPQRALIEAVFRQRNGLFLVSGPTGSGKTTTLYAGLELLKGRGLKILSVEDPVELQFDHVVQIQASAKIGLTFSAALRSILRHDPDVIMVGEIRDAETAQIAVQAALTGHLVVASLHARDAVRATSRLLDMGVEPYRLSAALIGSMAQRLVRRLCEACALSYSPDPDELAGLGNADAVPSQHLNWRREAGCQACGQTGYSGRLVAAEGYLASEPFVAALARAAPVDVLTSIVESEGYEPLIADAFSKAMSGETSISEALALRGNRS